MPKILITGATGYIGGSVLSLLLSQLSTSDPAIKGSTISAIVRRQSQADVLKAKGINPIFVKDLDDTDELTKAARDHDIVINTADSFHPPSAKALILGLGERKKQTGGKVYFIHTSGTSSVGDRPVTNDYIESREFSDKTNIYLYEEYREDLEQYGQRTTDLTVVRTGESVGVPTYIIMSPLIYGFGTGLFNTVSIQVPKLIRAAISAGHAVHVGDGQPTWDHVHIVDLASLYGIVLANILSGQDLPAGRKGIYFTSGGRHTWRGLAKRIGEAGIELGALQSAEPQPLTLEETARILTGGSIQLAQLGFGSRSVTKADLGAELGWNPKKTGADWEASILEEFKYILDKDKSVA